MASLAGAGILLPEVFTATHSPMHAVAAGHDRLVASAGPRFGYSGR
jgi:hypothetical protein